MINVRYIGAVGDSSGYASAGRSYIGALLDTTEVNLTVEIASFEQQKTTHGALYDRIVPYIDKPLDCKIQIVHLTPENYPRFRRSGCYNIAYTVWETTKIPDAWVPLCNLMDEIWVPSQWNIDVFRNSGVTKPLFKIPHGIPIPDLTNVPELAMSVDPDTYVFYSIFQWIERKNPLSLLKAYITEFQNDENVCLALKTYRLNTSPQEQEIIKKDILGLKQSLRMPKNPKIVFFGSLFPEDHIRALHKQSDYFVLPHRGEGFGIPHAEAMIAGNPVISSRYGGNLEFMNDKNSFLVDCQEIPVSGMIFSNYHGGMTWAHPDIMQIRKHMRYVYENQAKARAIGKLGQQTIKDDYNWNRIGHLMSGRLKEIQGKI